MCVCGLLVYMGTHNYQELISVENLFQAWEEFRKGKRKRKDVQVFERHLEDNLLDLARLLKVKAYKHGDYHSFYVQDPKLRHIHKAQVRDRVVHHLLYKYLYSLFDKTFIFDSYSCRLAKGTHKAVDRLRIFTRRVSRNYTGDCWVLKCDIKKFFASVDHQILLKLVQKRVKDLDLIWLLKQVLNSFSSEKGVDKGIPLGNLTSQVFANIYMNELDLFIKQQLRIKYYVRYADDFLLLSENKKNLESFVNPIRNFLEQNLQLKLHPQKIIFRKFSWGIDFLGYIVLPYVVLPRTKTKRRLFKKIKGKISDLKNGYISERSFNQSLQSYLGYLGHANSYKLAQELKNQIALSNSSWETFDSLKMALNVPFGSSFK